MATKQETIDFILSQSADAGLLSARKMFGEYGIYCDGKIVALVCDDRLFIKPTLAGAEFLGQCIEEPPYPGAKPYFLILQEKWKDRKWLSQLIRLTAAEIPLSKKR